MIEFLAISLFVATFVMLLSGYPVGMVISGVSIAFAFLGYWLGVFDLEFIEVIPNRIFSIMNNPILIAVPLFIFMGVMLEASGLAEDLLDATSLLFGPVPGGYAISTALVGALLAASTGIVGATVITMGLISLPSMIKHKYDKRIASGIICASGTLGQIIPPSIVLILLGDVMSTAYQEAQLQQQIFSPKTVSVGDLFIGALIPGLVLVAMYIAYLIVICIISPEKMPALSKQERRKMTAAAHLPLRIAVAIMPPLVLIVVVLGSILFGFASPTEAASIGGVGALTMVIAKRKLTRKNLRSVITKTTHITTKVFLIFIGSAFFALVFRGLEGDAIITDFLVSLPGERITALLLVMAVMFFLGFFLDFIEIILIIVPIVAPILLMMGFDPVWLGVLFAMNLQTSFLTPPFGFTLFYLSGVKPAGVSLADIYRGVIPFIGIQLLMIAVLLVWPGLITWLPELFFAS